MLCQGGCPRTLLSTTSEDQRRVRAAETERVGHGVLDFDGASLVRHQVEPILIVRLRQVGRWWSHLLAQCQNRQAGFEGAGTTEEMARHRLRRADCKARGVA